jgi:hypothetical protein
MDQSKRSALIEHLRRVGGLDESQPAHTVTLEQFFDGNDDYGSIGCNLTNHPSPEGFYRTLVALRDRKDVHKVLIEIHEVEESDTTMWPFSERVFVVTRCDQSTVAELFSPLQPSEIETGIPRPPTADNAPLGYTVFSAWWD